jgi:hypothetical protein
VVAVFFDGWSITNSTGFHGLVFWKYYRMPSSIKASFSLPIDHISTFICAS